MIVPLKFRYSIVYALAHSSFLYTKIMNGQGHIQ